MPLTDIDGIRTAYEVIGSGPPLLMLSPGGFNATMTNWSSFGRYERLRMVENLSTRFSCVIFDRRESGRSGGRLEVLGWDSYAAQAKGLLDHLGFAGSHVLGGCAGCSVGLALARRHPAAVRSLVLFSPAGGPRYRLSQQARFAVHLAFLAAEGPSAVVDLARSSGASFSSDARVGPWAPVLRSDPGFAESYSRLESGVHSRIVAGSARTMFDRDTVPGAEPEELMTLQVPTLIFPGDDDSHAPSAARYLQECLPRQTYVEVAVEDQGEELVRERTLSFLSQVDG